ncbi:MAG: chromate transporter [Bacillota bacterium]|nr:chromate transporter [Bacillota bacterium]
MLLAELFYSFLKIGIFSFGGGYCMLPLIQNEIITKNHWINLDTFIDIIATSQMTPGPIAINSATFIGFQLGGVMGSAINTFGVILFPAIIVMILSNYVEKFKDSKLINDIFFGLRPALVGLILASAFTVGRTAIFNIQTLLIAVAIFVVINKTKTHPILVIVLSGVLGAAIL